jgi:predicted nuclease of restriction endonuclease-like RecB superfamily
VLPALEACEHVDLVAEVRWGKARDPLAFRHSGGHHGATGEPAPTLRDDVSSLVEAWQALESPWEPEECGEILDLPGLGVCVPDLVFVHRPTRKRVHFEALGFWSRDAVWKRVELAQEGLGERLLFAVSSRLRVSEAVLDEVETAALYVYKGTMSPRAIERKLDALLARKKPSAPAGSARPRRRRP